MHPTKKSRRHSTPIENLEARLLASIAHASAAAPQQGLYAVYYANSDFTGASATEIDPGINFNWAGASPGAGIGATNFSARWTGTLAAPTAGQYTFSVQASDGVRLWVNNTLLINDWNTHATPITDTAVATLGATPASIRLEYFDGSDPASVSLFWSSSTVPLAVIPAQNFAPTTDPLLGEIDSTLGFARQQLNTTLGAMNGNTAAFPDYTNPDGTWATSNVGNWTAGFFGAELWQMFSRTNNPAWQQSATTWTLPLSVDQTFTDDLTFRIFNAYYPLYEATGNPAYKQVILNAAASKISTWNSTVGAFSSVGVASHSGNPNANFGVLMDHMMDLSMVFWAAKETGNQTWYNDALAHARTVAANFFRADGSVYQWGYFNKATGQFVDGENYQGYSDTSTWARAQAWAIYAFSVVYRETGAPDMLADAQRVANNYIANLPADSIPYWDFNAPGIPNTYRDTSAAAIAASGLLQLSQLDPDPTSSATYYSTAQATLTSLMSPAYLAQGSNSEGILLHGAWFVPAPIENGDASLVYGDYYLLEAINEYLDMPGALPGSIPVPSTTTPTIALSGSPSATVNAPYTLTLGPISDMGHTVSQITVNWGDGTSNVYSATGAVTHTFASTGPDTISVDLTDPTGTYTAAGTLAVNVTYPPPTLSITGSAYANAGGTYSLTLGPVNDVNGTPTNYYVHWGDGVESIYGSLGTVQHTFAKTGPVNVSVDVVDPTGNYMSVASMAVAVSPAPTMTLSGAATVAPNTSYALNLGAVVDRGSTVSQYVVHWGDGATSIYASGGVVTHLYASAQNALITVDLIDGTGTYLKAGSLAVTVVVPPVNLFPSSIDIGSPKAKGSSSFANGIYTVAGAGSDIYNTSDQFHYLYKNVTGNVTIAAKVTSVQNTNAWAKAGVMIRNGTAANAAFADVVVTPGGYLAFQYRAKAGGSSAETVVTGKFAPESVKLVRSGNSFSAYYSTNGTTWIQLGKTVSITMSSAVTTGLAVTSINTSKTSTATFSNVTVG